MTLWIARKGPLLTDPLLAAEKGLYSLKLGVELRGGGGGTPCIIYFLNTNTLIHNCEKCSALELLSETQTDAVRESYSMSTVAFT